MKTQVFKNRSRNYSVSAQQKKDHHKLDRMPDLKKSSAVTQIFSCLLLGFYFLLVLGFIASLLPLAKGEQLIGVSNGNKNVAFADQCFSMPGILGCCNRATKPSISQLQNEMKLEQAELELLRNEVRRLRNDKWLLMGNNLGDMTFQELLQLEKQLNDGLIFVKEKKDAMLFEEIKRSNREIEKLKQFLRIMHHKADTWTKNSANESAQEDAKKDRQMFQQLVRAASQPNKTPLPCDHSKKVLPKRETNSSSCGSEVTMTTESYPF